VTQRRRHRSPLPHDLPRFVESTLFRRRRPPAPTFCKKGREMKAQDAISLVRTTRRSSKSASRSR